MSVRFEPLPRRRAYEQVAHRLEQAILGGEIRPGERLPSERQLTSQFAVSRATVREALRSLEIDGLVESRPNDPHGGTTVRSPSSSAVSRSLVSYMRFDRLSLREVVEFRMFVESATAFLAASHRSDAQLTTIAQAHEQLRGKVGEDSAAFSVADVAFHDAIADAAGNRLLRVCSESANAAVGQLIGQTLQASPAPGAVMRDWIERHGRLVDAIKARDPMRAHRLAGTDICEYYSKYLSDEDASRVATLLNSAMPPIGLIAPA